MKKKSMLIDNDVPTVSEEAVTDKSAPEVEEVPYGNSFGQSAGLKDDLDVEDDGIGNSLDPRDINHVFLIPNVFKHQARRRGWPFWTSWSNVPKTVSCWPTKKCANKSTRSCSRLVSERELLVTIK